MAMGSPDTRSETLAGGRRIATPHKRMRPGRPVSQPLPGIPVPVATGANGWIQTISRDRRSLIGSLLAHGALITALVVSVSVTFPPKPETRTTTINVSLDEGDGKDADIPKASSEAAKEKVEDKTVPTPAEKTEPEKPVQEASEQEAAPSDAPPSDTPSTGKTGNGEMVWTPPAPNPNASGVGPDGRPREEVRVEMPKVDLPKGASDPILLSYDQGRFSDAAAMSEASRLMNTGTITMSVTVDEKGAVSQCVVTSTSGSAMLDQRACDLIRSYRYRPAQDAGGKPHGAIVSEVLEWARDGRFVEDGKKSAAEADTIRRADPSGPAPQGAERMPTVRLPGK
jgi:TonB family protein